MGIAFLFLGVLFLFDKGLLAIGNVSNQIGGDFNVIWHTYIHMHVLIYFLIFQILFLSGLGCVIGLERTFRFFFQRHKIKGSLAFFGGIFVVLLGFPIIGMVIESYGFFALFR